VDVRGIELIAQDVEHVLRELVVTNDDGLQGGRLQQAAAAHDPGEELKTQNDALKAQNDALKDRVAEIEYVIEAMPATSPRR
jgi:hypothetical protein